MTPEARKFYYDFVHIGLPKIFFENGEKLYDRLTKGNPDEDITRLWRTLAAQFNFKTSKKLLCEVLSIDEDRDLLVITLPDPKVSPEAFLVGLVFHAHRKLFTIKIEPERYFTLELGTNDEQRYIFCEWVDTNQHVNFGSLPDGSVKTFVKAIMNRRPSEQEFQDKTSSINTDTSTELLGSNSLDASGNTRNFDLDTIIDKWISKFPDEMFDKAFEKVKTFELQCNVLYNFVEVSGRLSQQKLIKLKVDIHNALVEASGRAMLIGAEFSTETSNILENIRGDNYLPSNAKKLLEIAREKAENVNYQLIDLASGHKPNAKEESSKVLSKLIEGQVQCFKLGATYINQKEKPKVDREALIRDTTTLSSVIEKKMHDDIFSKRFTSQAVLDKWETRIPEELKKRASLLMDHFRNECEMDFQQLKISKILPEFVLIAYEKIIKDVIFEISRNSLAIGAEYGENGMCEAEQITNYADIPDEANNYLAEFGEPAANLTFMLEQQLLKLGKQDENAKSKYVTSLMDGQIECFKLGVKYGESNRADNSILKKSNVDKFELNDTFNDLLDVAFHDPDASVRQQAQDGLRELHPGGPEGFDDMICELIEGLRDPAKRASSLEKLPAHREMALPMLIKYLKDPDPELRKLVTQVIIVIEKDRPRNKV